MTGLNTINETPAGGRVTGTVAPEYDEVRKAFVNNFKSKNDRRSAQCVVYVKGKKVVDLHGSSKNVASGAEKTYNADSLQIVFSSSKVMTSLVVSTLVDAGKLDYKERICTYWPEFAQNGKGDILLEDLMRHEAGLDLFEHPVTREEMRDFIAGGNMLTKLIEDTKPVWSDRSRRAYHAITRGFVINEIVRKVTGRTVGSHIKEMAAAAGVADNIKLGLTEEEYDSLPIFPLIEEPKLATLFRLLWSLRRKEFRTIIGNLRQKWNKERPIENALEAAPKQDGFMYKNAKWFYEFESPSHNYVSNARGLAGMINHYIKPAGTGPMAEQTLDRALEVSTDRMLDVNIGIPTTFCNGGWASFKGTRIFPRTSECGNGWFGWGGYGGSAIIFNRELDVVFSYTMTSLDIYVDALLGADPRSRDLMDATEKCLIELGVAQVVA